MVRATAVLLLVALVASVSRAAPAGARPETAAYTSNQICAAVQNKTLAVAVSALSALLPQRWQPSRTLKIITGAAVTSCPFWAKVAVKVGQAFVEKTKPPTIVPTVYPPAPALLSTNTMDLATGTATAFVGWFGLGIDRYQEQTRADGSFDPLVDISRAQPNYVYRPVRPGSTYQFFVRGYYGQNNATTWARSAAFKPVVVDDNLSTNGWSNVSGKNAYGGTLSYTTTGSVTYTVTGFAMAVVAPVYPGGGAADVSIDGAPVRPISFNSLITQPGRLVLSWYWPNGGRHTVMLTPTSGLLEIDAHLVLAQA